MQLQDAEAGIFRPYHPDVVSLIEPDRKVMPGDSVIAGDRIRHRGTTSNLHELRLVQASVPKEEWGNIKLTLITPAVSGVSATTLHRPSSRAFVSVLRPVLFLRTLPQGTVIEQVTNAF